VLAEVPTIGEFVPGFETGAFAGIGAPKGTSAEIIEILNRQITTGLADPTLKARIIDLGGIPLPTSPAEFGKLITMPKSNALLPPLDGSREAASLGGRIASYRYVVHPS